MKKRAVPNIILSFFSACSLTMEFAVPGGLAGDAGMGYLFLALENIRLSLNGKTLLLLLLCLTFYWLYKRRKELRIKNGVLFHLVCFCIALMWLFAQGFIIDDTLDALRAAPGQIGKSVIYFIGSFGILELAGTYILASIVSDKDADIGSSKLLRFYEKHGFWAYFITILLICLPVWIVSYPGYMDADSYCQLAYYFGIYEFYGQFPVLNTLYLALPVRLGYELGNSNAGLYLIVSFQMLVFSAVFAYMQCTLKRLAAPKWLRLISFALIAVSPAYTVVAACLGKDSIYSYGLLLFMIEITYIFTMGEDYWKKLWHILLLAVSIIVVSTMRNNGKYLIYVCAAVYLIHLCIKYRKSKKLSLLMAAAFLLPAAAAAAADSAAMKHYNVIPGSIREALAVPLQQTARYVYEHGDDITPEEQQVIENTFIYCYSDGDSIGNWYYSMDSSPVKQFFNNDMGRDELLEYFGVWLKQGLRHPWTYIKATANQTYPMFYPRFNEMPAHGETDSARHTHISEPIGLHDVDVANRAESVMRSIAQLLSVLPFPAVLTSTACSTLTMLLLCCHALERKRWSFLLYALPALLSIGTNFLAPAVLMRLIYAVIYSMPLLVCAYRNLMRTDSEDAGKNMEQMKKD